MTLWLSLAWLSAGFNAVLLVLLGSVWLRNYRQHGASHTLGLLVVAAFLLVENGLWLYFYLLNPTFRGWFLSTGTDIQVGVTLLCGLELVALLVLARVTWR
ncbi:hypothetical protein [Salinirussus salinus]|jgi:hypothetical protein|uniref:hypothetical protein n=1 Tax=Salinirussus salinus TaxID=1198300 RepID=UPI00135C7E42|nr:hypothetical protein [Salinirussus salinus]